MPKKDKGSREKILKNLFKETGRFGEKVGASNEGISQPEIFSYGGKAKRFEYFKKIPRAYPEDLEIAQISSDMVAYYEVIIGNLYNLYVDVPKTRALHSKTDNRQYVLSQKVEGAVSLEQANKNPDKQIPIDGMFSSIIISLAMQEGDLKPENFITDYSSVYRIDFAHSFSGESDEFSLNSLNFLDPGYLLDAVYDKCRSISNRLKKIANKNYKASLPQAANAFKYHAYENFDISVLQAVNALKHLAEGNLENGLINHALLAIKLDHLNGLQPQELQRLGIDNKFPESIRALKPDQLEFLNNLASESLSKNIHTTNEIDQRFLKNQIKFFEDVEGLGKSLGTSIAIVKKNAQNLLKLWYGLGKTDEERLRNHYQGLKENNQLLSNTKPKFLDSYQPRETIEGESKLKSKPPAPIEFNKNKQSNITSVFKEQLNEHKEASASKNEVQKDTKNFSK